MSGAWLHTPIRSNAKKLHIPAVQPEPRLHFVKGASHTRFEIERVQSVQKQQARTQLVAAEFIDGRLPGGAGVIDDFHDAFQPGALHFQQRRYQFARSRAHLLICYFINALNQSFNSPNTILKSLGCWIFHGS